MNLSDTDRQVWHALDSALRGVGGSFASARAALLAPGVDRVALFRYGLAQGEHWIATSMIPDLTTDELRQVFSELVWLASWVQGSAMTVRGAICALPRAWVVAHIEEVAAPLLHAPDREDEYVRLLELYVMLDIDLTRRLAEEALRQPDEFSREAGADFLAYLDGAGRSDTDQARGDGEA